MASLAIGPRGWLCLVVAYFAMHVCIRTALSPSADLDEADQLVLTQKAAWGYGSQPPLYTWLQISFFNLFGLSIFSLSLLKNLLLACTYGLTYLNAKLLTRSTICGVAAACSLLFIPQVAWESQRDLTHSVLSATLAAATLFCFLRTHESRRIAWYVGLGLVVGLGCLSKYNYVFWPLGLVIAGVSVPELRANFLNRRMLLAAAVCILVFLPNGLWMLNHRDLALLSASKLEIQSAGGWFAVVGLGLRNLCMAVVAFLGPLLLVYCAVFFRASARSKVEIPSAGTGLPSSREVLDVYEQFLRRTLFAVTALLLVLVVGFRMTGLKERWLQPILISAPVLAVAIVRNRMDTVHLKRLLAVSALVMVAVTVVMPGRILLAEKLKRHEPLTYPYRVLAEQMASVVPESSLVVTDTRLLAGNLRLNLPHRLVVNTELTDFFADHQQHWFVAWDTRRGEEPPRPLREWLQTHMPDGSLPSAPSHYFTATYQYHHQGQMRLALMRIR